MAKRAVGISVDAAEAGAVAGFLSQMALEIKTERHLSPVLKYVHARMSNDFDEWMALKGQADHARYHHVFEWGETGNLEGKLWRNVLKGSGASRLATWEWRASKKTVPVIPDAADKGVKQVHVFTWKAPVMEYETNITINPNKDVLAFFTEKDYGVGIFVTRGSITVQNPGGPETKGAFTDAFTEWWSGGGAEESFNTHIRQTLEQNLAKSPLEEVARPFRRAKMKTFRFNTIADYEAAVRAGSTEATAYMESLTADYLAQARAREALYGDISE